MFAECSKVHRLHDAVFTWCSVYLFFPESTVFTGCCSFYRMTQCLPAAVMFTNNWGLQCLLGVSVFIVWCSVYRVLRCLPGVAMFTNNRGLQCLLGVAMFTAWCSVYRELQCLPGTAMFPVNLGLKCLLCARVFTRSHIVYWCWDVCRVSRPGTAMVLQCSPFTGCSSV